MARVPTTLSTILTGVRQQLIDDSVFGSDEIFISLNPNIQHPPSNVYCILVPTGHTVLQPSVTGAGNTLLEIAGNFEVWVWSACAQDEANRDTEFLRDSSVGMFPRYHDIMDSIEQFDPYDASDDRTFQIPLRLLSIEKAERDILRPNYGNIILRYEVVYEIEITSGN